MSKKQKRPYLTRRRATIAQLLRSKLTPAEIAERLGLSRKALKADLAALSAIWRETAVADIAQDKRRGSEGIAREIADLVLRLVDEKLRLWSEGQRGYEKR